MFYLFIFESIGTSELMLIGLVALIVFGPRKLPELARTLGKTMTEFRRSTDEFKKTWEKEATFEDDNDNVAALSNLETEKRIANPDTISRELPSDNEKTGQLSLPEIKELNKEDFDKNFAKTKTEKSAAVNSDKQDWL